MTVHRCRIVGLLALAAFAIVMFARSASAFDGRVHDDDADAVFAFRPWAPRDPVVDLPRGHDAIRLPDMNGLATRAPLTHALLRPVLRPLTFLRIESISAIPGGALGHSLPMDPGVGLGGPTPLVDRILALPLRPVQIGESRRIPLDPKPTAGIVVKLSF